jgi:hypothetical protein
MPNNMNLHRNIFFKEIISPTKMMMSFSGGDPRQ